MLLLTSNNSRSGWRTEFEPAVLGKKNLSPQLRTYTITSTYLIAMPSAPDELEDAILEAEQARSSSKSGITLAEARLNNVGELSQISVLIRVQS